MQALSGTVGRAASLRLGPLAESVSRNAVLAPLVAFFAAFLLVLMPNEVWSDSWLAVLAGHEIVAHGLPAHDAVTVWAHGRQWVDQQWLAQLAFYGMYALGGIRLALLLHVAAAAAAYGGATAAGRARGGSVRSVLLVNVVVFFSFGFFTLVMRPQSLAYPLFVALFWLLVRYSRGNERLIWLVVPLLALWANIHGTVVLGSLLVLVAVAARAIPARRFRGTELLLTGAALLLPLASPYALQLPAYYRSVLLNPEFGQYVAEWRATTPTVLTYAFYGLAAGVLLLLGRSARALTPFERIALGLLLVLGFKATRGVPWFCLAAAMVAPVLLTTVLERDYEVVRGARLLLVTGLSAAALLLTLGSAVGKPASRFDLNYPPQARAAVVAAAGSHGRVYANETYADWLVLTAPELRGRIAFDARFELLSRSQLEHIAAVRVAQVGWSDVLRPYNTAVLRSNEDDLRRAMLRAGWRRVYHGDRLDVLER